MTLRYVGIASLVLLAGCGGGGAGSPSTNPPPQSGGPGGPAPTPTVAVAGAVQKGPFLVGSTVLVNRLDSRGRPTDSTIVTEIEDSVGSFSFETNGTGPVQLVASGYYFSELTGQISSGTLTLKAIYEVTGTASQSAYVNIMTHLINDRVRELIGDGTSTVTSAVSQAEREFLQAFAPALPLDGVDQFSGLSIYNTTGSTDDVGNAYLLALSTGFYQYATTKAQQFGTTPDAELTLILNQICDDFADDGQLQTADFMSEFIRSIRSLSPSLIAANLRSRSIVDYPAGIDVPDISRFLNLCAGVAECAWRSGAPMPQPTALQGTADFGGKLYSFGGASPDATEHRSVYAYDPVANTWTAKQPMPVSAYVVAAQAVGDKIYVMPLYGSEGFMDELFEYDPPTDTWTPKAERPTHRYDLSAVALNGRLYVIGGHGTIDDGPWESGKPWSYKSHVEVYDPATNAWSSVQPLPYPLASTASCVAGDKIFVFGGRDSSGVVQASTLVYDTSADAWSTRSPLPAGRENHTCTEVGDAFLLVGGVRGSSVLDAVDHYDPATDSWASPTRMTTRRHRHGAEAVGGEVVIVGGSGQGSVPLDSVEILNPLL
jgi:N-acetylneuraminic acid mutarotase